MKSEGAHGSGTGLKRGLVQIVAHKSEWAEIYLSEVEKIKACVGEIILSFEHVGSTSVRGLVAKPIIDIAIGVESRKDILLVVKRLVNAGYIDRGDQGGNGGYLVVKESDPGVRILYIHIMENTDVQWRNYIAFRECLRGNRSEYACLKKSLAQRFPEDRKSYTDGKNEFIKRILSRIV